MLITFILDWDGWLNANMLTLLISWFSMGSAVHIHLLVYLKMA